MGAITSTSVPSRPEILDGSWKFPDAIPVSQVRYWHFADIDARR